MAKRKGISKDEHTIAEHRFKTEDSKHKLYAQEWGNPKGTPILFLHGGPGGGCDDGHKNVFNPKHHKVIFFDQRGAGRSEPKGSLEDNTTQKLIEDIELIRGKLKLNSVVVDGGSWGSLLGLCYAIAYPSRVQALVLRGVFLGSQEEIDWLHRGGFRQFFPEVWEKYLSKTPKPYQENPGQYHANRGQKSLDSAKAYIETELSLLSLDDRYKPIDDEDFDPTFSNIEAHYLSNSCFLPDNHVLDNLDKLTMPVWIVQGRYDFVCTPRVAYELDKKLPNSELLLLIAGHSGSDRAIYDTHRTILAQFKNG